jgi:hypothetical protein
MTNLVGHKSDEMFVRHLNSLYLCCEFLGRDLVKNENNYIFMSTKQIYDMVKLNYWNIHKLTNVIN